MYEALLKASVDHYLSQYQAWKMNPVEKGMQFANCMKELENKFLAVDHTVGIDEQKRILLRGLSEGDAIIVGVIRTIEGFFKDAVSLLVIRESEKNGTKKYRTNNGSYICCALFKKKILQTIFVTRRDT